MSSYIDNIDATRHDHLTSLPYGVVTTGDRLVKTLMWITPCTSVSHKCAMGLLRSTKTGELFLCSFILQGISTESLDKRYAFKSLLKTLLPDYDVLAASLRGGRFSYNSDGFYTFGIDDYPIIRIHIHQPQIASVKVNYLNNHYWVQTIQSALWSRENHPTLLETDSYLQLGISLLVEINAQRQSLKAFPED